MPLQRIYSSLFDVDSDLESFNRTKSRKRNIYDIDSSLEEDVKRRKKTIKRPKRLVVRRGSSIQSHPWRERTFSEFDDYELIVEEDRSPRRPDWVFVEEQVEPSERYRELLKENWKLALDMETRRIGGAVGGKDRDAGKSADDDDNNDNDADGGGDGSGDAKDKEEDGLSVRGVERRDNDDDREEDINPILTDDGDDDDDNNSDDTVNSDKSDSDINVDDDENDSDNEDDDDDDDDVNVMNTI